MRDSERDALIGSRLEKAREDLNSAIRELEANALRSSASRSYYSIFHAMRAVLANEGFDAKKHTGIISAFRQRYIKVGIFPPELSDTIQSAFDNRGKSDYGDFAVITKEEATQQVENAKTFLAAVEAYIATL